MTKINMNKAIKATETNCQPKLKQLISKDKINSIIENVHQRIIFQNIQYDNRTAFKTFISIMEKEYPSEFMILSERFTHETCGMRNHFERNSVYRKLFITPDESLSLQDKIFTVFDIQRVGCKVPKLKFRQLDMCKRQFHKLYPDEWEQVHNQCGGAVCISRKFDNWLQEQYRAYKKQRCLK